MMLVNTKFSPEFQAKQNSKRARKVRAQFLKDHPEVVRQQARETQQGNRQRLILKNGLTIRGQAWVEKVRTLAKSYQVTGLNCVDAMEKALQKSW